MAGLSENPRRNTDGRNLHLSGSDRVDSSHQVSHPRSGTPLPQILQGLLQLHPGFRRWDIGSFNRLTDKGIGFLERYVVPE